MTMDLTACASPWAHPERKAQRGLSLIVVLLFLVAITSIAVLSARKATLEEGLGRNQLDMEAARQAAESALRDAERDLSGVIINAAKCYYFFCKHDSPLVPRSAK
jgi:type IV pilus assembly protein PilX